MRIRAAIIPVLVTFAPFAIAPAYSQAQDRPTSALDLVQSDAVGLSDAAAMRAAGEAAVRQHLVDPASAIFDWPYRFIRGRWQTILKARYYDGDVTCGFVNAKNRFGGYAGNVSFVVVISRGSVIFSDVGTGRGKGRDFVSDSCARSVAAFSSPAE